MGRRVRVVVALGLGGVLLLAGATAPRWTSAALARVARLPGSAGEWGARRLAARQDEPATQRALSLLADGSVAERSRAAIARACLERRERRALPPVMRALNGSDPFLAATCSALLARFAGAGSSFAAEDPPERRAEVVREWNLWWRRLEVAPVATTEPRAADWMGAGAGGDAKGSRSAP